MKRKLNWLDVDLLNGDLVIALPGDKSALIPAEEIFKLAAAHGISLPENDFQHKGAA